jgi:hypothetical protein
VGGSRDDPSKLPLTWIRIWFLSSKLSPGGSSRSLSGSDEIEWE